MNTRIASPSSAQSSTAGRVIRLLAFMIVTVFILEIWNYAIVLPVPALSISEIGFMIGILFTYYGLDQRSRDYRSKDWLVLAGVGLASGWGANLAWLAYEAWA